MPTDRLASYREKRDRERTPEPFGQLRRGPTLSQRSGGLFVVQQHAARRLHWDLRLDIDGVLVSWAVPRGPSLDPRERRLAVQTEAHPIEYADFEGLIPAGNYGAGAMIVWDRGVYQTIDASPVAAGLQAGKIDFILRGQKLRGRFALVRTKGDDGRSWLLLHKLVGAGKVVDIVQQQPRSVFSGLTVEELRAGTDRTEELHREALARGGVRREVSPTMLRPMLAQPGELPSDDTGWDFELKYDGMRVIAARRAAEVRLVGRSGREASTLYPETLAALRRLPCSEFVLDGEVVALDERGVSLFELLQPRMQARDAVAIELAAATTPVVLYAFDLLHVAGVDVRGLPLRERRHLLTMLVPELGLVRSADVFQVDARKLFASVSQLGFEGIVGKRADSPYRSGERSPQWRKIKARRSADLVVVGYQRGKGSRQRLGALMLAWRDGDGLRYAGNVGSGFSGAALTELLRHLESRARAQPAFESVPTTRRGDTVFVEPDLVAQVSYGEVTRAGILRHPVFERLRDDKPASEADTRPRSTDERPPPEPLVAVAESSPPPAFRPSNLDKVFWPNDGFTKGDLLSYYESVWPWLAPYLRDRPLVMTRYPDGIDGKSFFQKNAPDFTPAWATTCRVDDTDFFLCNDLETLRYVINSGCIPLHIWSARVGSLDHPDWSILDLDPKGAAFRDVVAIARLVHELLERAEVAHFVKTSGQDGLHILIPTGGQLTHDESRAFAELLARAVVEAMPEIATIARAVEARAGKVYVDYLQNGRGKTIAGPFSARPRSGAPVSMPLTWRYVGAKLNPAAFTIKTVVPRLKKSGDPMSELLAIEVDWAHVLHRLESQLR